MSNDSNENSHNIAPGQINEEFDKCPPQFTKTAPRIISKTTLTHFCGPKGYNCSIGSRYEQGIEFQEKYEQTKEERRKNLESMLHREHNDVVILMTVNYGFLWLFSNWLCSLEHNLNKAQIEQIKKMTIVLVTDEKAQKKVNKMGFPMTHYPHWLGQEILSKIWLDAPPIYGSGSHREINALTIGLMNDLIQLNYSVLLQDVDIVWNNDPIHYLISHSVYTDLLMSSDGRGDAGKGPGNSGFLFIKSNCKTKIFAQTLWNARSRVDSFSDQMVWNRLIDDRMFRQMSFSVLDESLFANGHLITLKYGGSLDPNHFIFHCSWTQDVFDKIEKFWIAKHFYYQSHLCAYYDENMVVDISTRMKHKIEQEAKFLKLGIFKNETKNISQALEQVLLLEKMAQKNRAEG